MSEWGRKANREVKSVGKGREGAKGEGGGKRMGN